MSFTFRHEEMEQALRRLYCTGDHGIRTRSTHLCDWPIGDAKTCDMGMCEEHATEVGHDRHYCPVHVLMWRDLKRGDSDE